MKDPTNQTVEPSCYVIAEAGLNHNGSMALAKELIDVAASAGADAVKFQKRHVATLAVKDVLDANDDRFPSLGNTYREIRECLEFDIEQYRDIKAYTASKGLDFLCTAFDQASVAFLEDLGVDRYKIASHSNTNFPLLRHLAVIGKPVYLSTGACTLDELDEGVEIFLASGTPLVVLHCVSSYPTPIDELNLGMIDFFRQRYNIPVGYSGHEIGYLPTVTAVALGAVAVERHFTTDKNLPGFDHKLSLEPAELTQMVEDIRTIQKIVGTAEKSVTDLEMITRNKYKVSMVSRQPIPAGTVITEELVTYKNPGIGIHPRDAAKVLGREASMDIQEDALIQIDMVV